MRIVQKAYNYYWSKDKELARKLRPILGFVPAHMHLFKLAFYHRSMQNDMQVKTKYNNERLEFLGDSVLSTIVAEYLFMKYPHKDEGFLTKMRSKIVKRNALNEIADKMGLDMILADFSVGKMSSSMLGNALEALVGAIYIEFGYKKTSDYVIKHILMRYLDIHELENQDDNYKSILLESCQKHGKEVEFRIESKTKFDKRDWFVVGVYIDNEQVATGDDFNKKAAEQKAAQLALHAIEID
ncbi:MAG TPA: ribonuclease III [Saprospiraceae bacterium]|nr:ribonuclease III [Saprospiraceae bacterium]